MSYEASNIVSIIEKINKRLFLPAIQRPFVWEPEQIIALFDSVLKGYPISSFLFWELAPENRKNWEIYRFIDNFQKGQVHNEIAESDGLDVTLVLDGQQRLTSLLIGLKGRYKTKKKYKRHSSLDSWEERRLYLNLLRDPTREDDDEVGVTYGLRFFEERPAQANAELWIKLGDSLDWTSDAKFEDYKDNIVDSLHGATTRDQIRLIERNLNRLYATVWKDRVISYYTEKVQSYDRVLDIFIRANDGGTKLSRSDLLLSMVTSKWDDMNAREEIYGFVDYLNEEMTSKNSFDKDFVLRSSLVLTDLPHVYKVSNFTNRNLEIIRSQWTGIKKSIESTVSVVNSFGLDRETLTSVNTLLPIAYYIHKQGGIRLDGSSEFEASNAERIRRWLYGALINGVFSGSVNHTIGVARDIVRDSLTAGEQDFPLRQLVEKLRNRGRAAVFDESTIENVLLVEYGAKECFLALSLLYDDRAWGGVRFHIDHVFPRALLAPKNLRERGLPERRIAAFSEAADRIGNLQILLARENNEKSATPFGDWVRTRDASFLNRHLIPEDPHLWRLEQFPEFVAERERLIRDRIRRVYGGARARLVPAAC